MTEQINIDVLGPIDASAGGLPIPLGGPKQRAALAALVLAEGRVVAVAALVDVLWDTAPPPTAVTKVQGHVYALRKALGHTGTAGQALVTRAPGYLLRSDLITTDLARFDALTRQSSAHAQACRPADASDLLAAAIALWRGAAFADVPAPAIRAAADRLAERYLRAVEDKARLDLDLGRYRRVLDETVGPLEEHPFRDRLHELHMLALIRMGRPLEAIASYQRCRLILSKELGVEPGGRLRRLAASIGYQS